MSMVHDNIIKGYKVDFENEIFAIETEYVSRDSVIEKTTVVFHHYLTHIFSAVMKGSIIFDIEEMELSNFMAAECETLELSKSACWPIYYETTKDLENYLRQEEYRVFFIISSLGLRGWIVAKYMELVTVCPEQS